MPTAKREDKNRKAIRSERIKLITTDEDKKLLDQAAELCQQAHNRLLFEVKRWHIEQGNDIPLRNWIIEYKEHQRQFQAALDSGYKHITLPDRTHPKERREAKQKVIKAVKKQLGNPPKCPVHFLPKEAAALVRRRVIDAMPTLHDKVLGQLLHSAISDLNTHKSTVHCFGSGENRDGRFKRWHRIVADLGEQPSYTNSQPIPIKPEQLTVHIPEDPNDQDATWSITVRLDRHRDTVDGQPANRRDGKPKFLSAPHSYELITKEPKRANGNNTENSADTDPEMGQPNAPEKEPSKPKLKLAKIRHTLRRCFGHAELPEYEYEPKGTKILERDGEWYLLLPYQQKKWVPMKCDKRRTAVLKPAKDHPWLLTTQGEDIIVKGKSNIVAKLRERLNIQGRTRREISKGGRQGRGYRRVHRRRVTMEPFKRTFTRQSVAQVIKILADRQIGKLELHLPTTPYTANQTYLAKAGAKRRPESWPWEFVKSEFQRQADRLGFALIVKPLQYPKEDEKGEGQKAG